MQHNADSWNWSILSCRETHGVSWIILPSSWVILVTVLLDLACFLLCLFHIFMIMKSSEVLIYSFFILADANRKFSPSGGGVKWDTYSRRWHWWLFRFVTGQQCWPEIHYGWMMPCLVGNQSNCYRQQWNPPVL